MFLLIIVYLFTGIFPWWVLAIVDVAAIGLGIYRWGKLRQEGATAEAKRQFLSSVRIFILLTVLVIITLVIPAGK